MHALFLILFIPFVFLFAVFGLTALVMVVSVAVEFPLLLLGVVGLGLVSRFLSNLSQKRAQEREVLEAV